VTDDSLSKSELGKGAEEAVVNPREELSNRADGQQKGNQEKSNKNAKTECSELLELPELYRWVKRQTDGLPREERESWERELRNAAAGLITNHHQLRLTEKDRSGFCAERVELRTPVGPPRSSDRSGGANLLLEV
jgi:hypothetical protein